MANIVAIVAQIRAAVLGKDVRESIASGIEGINTEVVDLESTFGDLIINAGSSNSEIVVARDGEVDLSTKIATKSDKIDVRLKAVKLNATLDFDDITKEQMTGTTPITYSPIADYNSIISEQLSFPTIIATKGKNLFNKATCTDGFYIDGAGTIQVNAAYSYSDFISILPNTPHYATIPTFSVYYTKDKIYIEGGLLGNPHVSANNAYYAIFSMETTIEKNIFQLEAGSVATAYEAWHENYIELKNIDPSVTDDIAENVLATVNLKQEFNLSYFERIMKQLENPFIKTQIKLLGDSITDGVGGTGYSSTGEFMLNDYTLTDRYSNVYTAVCWANMLRNNVLANYNKENYIAMNDKNIINTALSTLIDSFSYKYGNSLNVDNSIVGQSLEFNFYGDHFGIVYSKYSAGGILGIYVDGVKIADLDTYNVSNVFMVETAYTGLTVANHIVEIKTTNTKNASSTGLQCYLENIKIPKTVIFKNWGVSGALMEYTYNQLNSFITTSDDIIIMQMGTNDRQWTSPVVPKRQLRKIIEDGITKGVDWVIMSASPPSVTNENEVAHEIHMNDINDMLRDTAKEYNMPIISNYNYFIEYAELKGVTVDSLLADGLHPNDTGYKVMYQNIAKQLGLSLLQTGIL